MPLLAATVLTSVLLVSPPLERGHLGWRCGTPELMQGLGRPALRPQERAPAVKLPKSARDAFGVFANEVTSTNFALKWGDSGGVDESDAGALLDAFEVGWAFEVGEMEHDPPFYSDTFLFNVYLGDTGSGTPPTYDAGGYFYYDPDGYPMIVINPDRLDDWELSRVVAPHELYHAVQDSTLSYSYEGIGAWYFEATAEWVVAQVVPGSEYFGSFVAGFSLAPQLPVDFFDYPDEGKPEEMHQYGAFIFPHYLSQQVADWRLIRDSWKNAGGNEDPLAVLDGLLAQYDLDIETAFGDFAARNATWDYEEERQFEEANEYLAVVYPEYDHRVVNELRGAGAGWQRADWTALPQRFGYNVITLAAPIGGTLTAGFRGDAEGSEGSTASYRVTVVRELGAGREYVPLVLTAGAGEIEIPEVGDETAIHLVVTASCGSRHDGEEFGYEYRLEIPPPPSPSSGSTTRTAQPADGCTDCSASSSSPFAILVALAAHRRRRASRRLHNQSDGL